MNALGYKKPYEISFEMRPDYLYVYVKSDVISYEITKQYWVEILGMRDRRRYRRVMIEKDISADLPLHDAYRIVSELAHSGCNDVRFAIVDRYYNAEMSKFEEMVGANRGLTVKITANQEEAGKWLSGH